MPSSRVLGSHELVSLFSRDYIALNLILIHIFLSRGFVFYQCELVCVCINLYMRLATHHLPPCRQKCCSSHWCYTASKASDFPQYSFLNWSCNSLVPSFRTLSLHTSRPFPPPPSLQRWYLFSWKSLWGFGQGQVLETDTGRKRFYRTIKNTYSHLIKT